MGLTPAQISSVQRNLPASVFIVTLADGSTATVSTTPGAAGLDAVHAWIAQGNSTTPFAQPPALPQLYEVGYAIQLQQKLIAVSQELSQNTSAPAAVTVLRNNIVRELVRIRSLPAAPVTTQP